MKEHLTNDFILEIIDLFDGWLTDKGVRVKNEDRDKDNPENTTNFYGDDFDYIMEGIRDICDSNGIIVEDKWDGPPATESVLDKIRAEIEEAYMNITYQENKDRKASWGLRKALQIIDKYEDKWEG